MTRYEPRTLQDLTGSGVCSREHRVSAKIGLTTLRSPAVKLVGWIIVIVGLIEIMAAQASREPRRKSGQHSPASAARSTGFISRQMVKRSRRSIQMAKPRSGTSRPAGGENANRNGSTGSGGWPFLRTAFFSPAERSTPPLLSGTCRTCRFARSSGPTRGLSTSLPFPRWAFAGVGRGRWGPDSVDDNG